MMKFCLFNCKSKLHQQSKGGTKRFKGVDVSQLFIVSLSGACYLCKILTTALGWISCPFQKKSSQFHGMLWSGVSCLNQSQLFPGRHKCFHIWHCLQHVVRFINSVFHILAILCFFVFTTSLLFMAEIQFLQDSAFCFGFAYFQFLLYNFFNILWDFFVKLCYFQFSFLPHFFLNAFSPEH